MDKKTVEFCGEIVNETRLAYLVFDGDKEVWIPKSQVLSLLRLKPSKTYEFTIPEWLAIEKEII